MSGDKIFVDTNILVYLFQGDAEIARILDGKDIVISFITEMELLSFPKASKKELKYISSFINHCQVIHINNSIKETAISYRKSYSLKLPDAIVAASADYFNLPLFTADRDFEKIAELNLLLYQ